MGKATERNMKSKSNENMVIEKAPSLMIPITRMYSGASTGRRKLDTIHEDIQGSFGCCSNMNLIAGDACKQSSKSKHTSITVCLNDRF